MTKKQLRKLIQEELLKEEKGFYETRTPDMYYTIKKFVNQAGGDEPLIVEVLIGLAFESILDIYGSDKGYKKIKKLVKLAPKKINIDYKDLIRDRELED